MAITPKGIIDSAVGFGRAAVSAGVGLAGRLRGGDRAPATPTPSATTPETAETGGATPATAKTGRATPGTAKTGRATPRATKTARAKASGTKTTPKRAPRPSGSPKTVGASKPGEAGGPKSGTSKRAAP
jgi:hypothetical protein